MGKRELVALLNLSSWCLVMVERLFLAVPRVCLRFVIVIFPDHTHLLYFIPNFVCVLTNERYKHIGRDFHSVTLVMPQGGTLVHRRCPGGSIFFKHVHVTYQIDRGDEQNKLQVTFSS